MTHTRCGTEGIRWCQYAIARGLGIIALLALALAAGAQDATPGDASSTSDAGPDSAAVNVSVRSCDGTPVRDALVEVRQPAPAVIAAGTARPLDGSVLVSARTDAEGAAHIGLSSSGAWLVHVSAEGHTNAILVVTAASAGPGVFEAFLADGHELRGTITQEEGAPVTDAIVFAGPIGFEGDPESILAQCRTDGEGHYALHGLPAGPTDVWAERPGSGPRSFYRIGVPGVATADVVFPGGTRVQGVVRDEATDEPVSGVRVRYVGLGGGSAEAVSGSDGRYELHLYGTFMMVDRIEIGPAPWELAADESASDGGGAPMPLGSNGGVEVRDVVVRRGAPAPEEPREAVHGRVTDREGRPQCGVLVGVPDSEAWSVSDAEGAFEVRAAGDLADRLTVHGDDWTLVGRRTDDTGGTHLVIAPAERVFVRVSAADRSPVVGARVTLRDLAAWERRSWLHVTPGPRRPREAWTNARGFVRIPWSGATSGTPLRVLADGHVVAYAQIEDPRHVTEVVLSPDRPVRVRVVDADDGEPVAGAWVRATHGTDDEMSVEAGGVTVAGARGPIWDGRTGEDGVHALRGFASGRLTVTVWDATHHGQSTSCDVESDREVVVRMEPYRTITGRVEWPEGVTEPDAAVGVLSVGEESTWCGSFGIAPDGTFTVGGLRDGAYELAVQRDRAGSVACTVHGPFEAGATDVRIVAHRPHLLRGRVVRPDGTPVAGAELELAPRGRFLFGVWGVDCQAQTDDDGRFEVPDAAPGGLVVRMLHHAWGASGNDRRACRWTIINQGDDPQELTVEPGLAISGRLVSADTGEPLTGYSLIALPVGTRVSLEGDFYSETSESVTDANGRFRIEGLAPGRYRIWPAPPGVYCGPPWEPEPYDPDSGTEAGTENVVCKVRW